MEYSLTDPNMTSSAVIVADSLHPMDIRDTNNDSDKLNFTNTYRSDKEAGLESKSLQLMVAVTKPDRDETPMLLQEEGFNERDGVALPTITMALISRRSGHRTGTIRMRSKPQAGVAVHVRISCPQVPAT